MLLDNIITAVFLAANIASAIALCACAYFAYRLVSGKVGIFTLDGDKGKIK